MGRFPGLPGLENHQFLRATFWNTFLPLGSAPDLKNIGIQLSNILVPKLPLISPPD